MTMTNEHPNISVIKRFDPRNIAGTQNLFSEDVVFHCFNPLLPDLQGDYVGSTAIGTFFEKVGTLTGGSFRIIPVSVTAVGDELVVTHTKNRMKLAGQSIETDVVVVWRIVDGRITEVWDIPSVNKVQFGDT